MIPQSERFILDPKCAGSLRDIRPQFGFGLFGEAVYYRSYSRTKADGTQETWGDTVLRVVEGVMSMASVRSSWASP